MATKKRARYSNISIALFAAVVLTSGIVAFNVGVKNPYSQVAVGAQADAMCTGNEDAKCQCQTGFAPGSKNCDGKTRGGGKIGCPCYDITAGQEAASGKCASVGKCAADKAGGMMPMLPMLPMMMPKMPMPMMPMPPEPCPPTASPTSKTEQTDKTKWSPGAPPCPDSLLGGISDLLKFGEKSSSTSATSSLNGLFGSTSTSTKTTSLIRFIESFGFFKASTSSGEIETEIEPYMLPFRVVLSRSDTGHLRLSVENTETGEEAFGHSTSFGQSTFTYTGPPSSDATVFTQVRSTFGRLLDTIRSWIWP